MIVLHQAEDRRRLGNPRWRESDEPTRLRWQGERMWAQRQRQHE